MSRLSPEQKYLSARKVMGLEEDAKINPLFLSMAERIFGIEKFNRMLAEAGPPWPDANSLIDFMFKRLNIKYGIENENMLLNLDARPKVFVANHPYGLPDAFAMFQILTNHRPNIKLFANKILAASRLEDDRLLFVDPFMADGSRGVNRKSVATALKHLRDGGDLALFPGRIVSHLKTSDWMISDSGWTDQIFRFVEISGGDLVPMFISGRNSMMFNMSGLIHSRIRTYLLLREFMRGGHDFRFRVGEPVSAAQMQKAARTLPTGEFSRALTYALKTPKNAKALEAFKETGEFASDNIPESVDPVCDLAKISGAKAKALLDQHEKLVDQNGYTIYLANPGINEELLDVICEVRYAAFATDTGVESPSELKDKFDPRNSHLILWDDTKKMVIGVYRFLVSNANSGIARSEDLVTSTIFDLKPGFLKMLPNSMELGRAAILPEYQKSFAPLMLLWRGILEIPKRDHGIKYLFGPVTMGRAFKPVSHELLRRFVMEHCRDEGMVGFVEAKRKLEFDIPREIDLDKMASACNSFAQLSAIVSGFEGGKRDLPVLFRHYAHIGCRYIGFGEWKELDRATAGLTVLDLKNMSKTLLSRFFGKEGMEAFLLGR